MKAPHHPSPKDLLPYLRWLIYSVDVFHFKKYHVNSY